MGRSYRNRDDKGAASAHATVDLDGTAVQFDQFLHQGQPDAAPFVRATARLRDAMEPFEQARKTLGRNTDARIADA